MREIYSKFGHLWVSSESNKPSDSPVEKILSTSLPAQALTIGSPLHAGIRIFKMSGPPGIDVVLGATYSPSKTNTLTIESPVLKPVNPINEIGRKAWVEQFEETAELILDEATKTFARCSALKAGTVRFDIIRLNPAGYHPMWWRYGTRLVVGLLSLNDYEILSDDDIVTQLEDFAKDVP